ncbi:MAG TPA: hypothetical protein VLX90_16295, partial [Steroidobacteraceae bacterium]|nr:hypothetical protein [Steroidobacteraceae bacterium]
MQRTAATCAACILGVLLATVATAQVAPPGIVAERAAMNSIAEVGFNHSEIPETAEYLADQIGGRMTNS